ncbi:MAG: hypothetical protein KDB27_00165 [Planctomycetales bacterium]|nr:hypothetical protein [Planctomycetales bacterium]
MDREAQGQSASPSRGSEKPAGKAAGTGGKLLVIGIVAVAVAASVFAWNFRKQQSHRTLGFFGGTNASLIRTAQKVEWLEVEHSPSEPPTTTNLKFSPPLDVTDQRGLIHARAALISDVSFDWDTPPDGNDWEFAMRFIGKDDASCTVLFDISSKKCLCLDNGNSVSIGEKLAEGLHTFRSEIPNRNL